MGSMLLSFSSFFGSFFDAFFYGFYFTIRCFFVFMDVGMGIPGYYWVFLIIQLIVVGITLSMAKGKGYSIFLTLLLCLAIPLLGCLIIITFLPDEKISYSRNTANNTPLGSIPTTIARKLTKKCKSCKREVDEDESKCPHCGNDTFE